MPAFLVNPEKMESRETRVPRAKELPMASPVSPDVVAILVSQAKTVAWVLQEWPDHSVQEAQQVRVDHQVSQV